MNSCSYRGHRQRFLLFMRCLCFQGRNQSRFRKKKHQHSSFLCYELPNNVLEAIFSFLFFGHKIKVAAASKFELIPSQCILILLLPVLDRVIARLLFIYLFYVAHRVGLPVLHVSATSCWQKCYCVMCFHQKNKEKVKKSAIQLEPFRVCVYIYQHNNR